ncbi:MAG: hypothetical protein CMK09_03755 [Ponticaulis sp.]|nr:hypothetical protein [Ponticaulis sp.]
MTLLLTILIVWGALRAAPPIPKFFDQQDKLEHILAFGALTLWLTALTGPRRWKLAGGLAVCAAIGLELAQTFLVASRQGSLPDLIASLIGIVLATLFVISVRHVIRNQKQPVTG